MTKVTLAQRELTELMGMMGMTEKREIRETKDLWVSPDNMVLRERLVMPVLKDKLEIQVSDFNG